MAFFSDLLLQDVKILEILHLVFSVIVFVVTILVIVSATLLKSKRLTFNGKLLLFTVCVAISMWLIQFVSDSRNPNFSQETLFEMTVLSFYHTLKAFGADDNFLVGMNYVETLFLNNTLKSFYRNFAVILSYIAPLTSATIFFELLSNFFPKLRLFFFRYIPFKKKYYFSELNERSLALSKSILETQRWCSPVIVFTDVYVDKNHEKMFKLLTEAKRIGAICIRDDIIHIAKRGLNKRKFFLIDDNEIKNLQTLTNLTDKFNYKFLKKSEIYIFCQDYIYSDIEKQVRKKLKCEYGFNEDDLTIIPVRCYRNLITNMLVETPLYEPLIEKRKLDPCAELELNITIIGVGDVGTEMFLTTYWMGQMLNCKLNITVISKETESEFWGKIDNINPEIRRTLRENGCEKVKDELLRVYSKTRAQRNDNDILDDLNFAEPYGNVNYISCDIESEEFSKLLEGDCNCFFKCNRERTVLDTHYFLVSLGSDQKNLFIANTLKKRIGKYHIEHKELNDKTIINYVVYNPDLSLTINSDPYVCSYGDEPDIYMQAIGGIEQNYTARNIFMNKYINGAKAAAKNYDSKQNKKDRFEENRKRLEDEYKYWANIALCLHFKYKVFSIVPFEKSLFNKATDYSKKSNAYKDLVRSCKNENELKVQHNLQWLEHRRWNAFLRTMGYRQTNDYEQYVQLTESHKQIEMKLHPCLVECDKKGEYIELNESGEISKTLIKKVDGKVVFKKIINGDGAEIVALVTEKEHVWVSKGLVNNDGEPVEKFNIVTGKGESVSVLNADYFDLLDQLTIDLAMLSTDSKVSIYDFKMYDYPNSDYLSEV